MLCCVLLFGLLGQAKKPTSYLGFKGQFLVAMSDVDMVASAYVDNQIGKREPSMFDAMTIIPLDRNPRNIKPIAIPVSTSVGAWPNNLAFTPDRKFAFVAEVFGPAPKGATLRSDIPSGRLLTVVDLRNPKQAQVSDRIKLGNQPMAVAVHPSGNLLAVSLSEPGRQIAFIPFTNGKLGTPTFQGHPSIDDPKVHTPHLEWHPSGRFLSVTFPTENEAIFYEVDRSDLNNPKIRKWGNSVMTGKFPGVGHFTPDGRYLITTNLLWGEDVEGTYIGAHYGHFTVIKFAQEESQDGNVRHQIVSTAPVGGSAEEFAISPDSKLVVALNMERSFLPSNDPRLTKHSSLTLLTLSTDTGQLTPMGSFPFEGILPEGITFDATGDYLAVANFSHFNPAVKGGSIDFWQVVKEDVPKLVKQDISLPIMRGVHILKLLS